MNIDYFVDIDCPVVRAGRSFNFLAALGFEFLKFKLGGKKPDVVYSRSTNQEMKFTLTESIKTAAKENTAIAVIIA